MSLAALIVGYLAWVSWPEASDRAEVTDTCSFPTITNAQYRALVAEAKALIAPMRRRIASGDGNLEQGTRNPPLEELAREFLKRSRSTEEAFVRLFALGRALNGRIEDAAPHPDFHFPGPWVTWIKRDSNDKKLSKPQLWLSGRFQSPPGTFSYPIGTLILARLFGRRYEDFRLAIWFDPSPEVPLDDALTGSNVVDVHAFKSLLVYLLNSIRWGDVRIENRCPNAERFLDHANSLLTQRRS